MLRGCTLGMHSGDALWDVLKVLSYGVEDESKVESGDLYLASAQTQRADLGLLSD